MTKLTAYFKYVWTRPKFNGVINKCTNNKLSNMYQVKLSYRYQVKFFKTVQMNRVRIVTAI
ncbi:hypothetical protein Hanom_Chr04g00382291 [Helianthus anomalus]